MNFGDILSYFKSRTGGANIDRAQVARLVDEAQIEIAKRHGVIVRKGYYSAEKGEGYDLPLIIFRQKKYETVKIRFVLIMRLLRTGRYSSMPMGITF